MKVFVADRQRWVGGSDGDFEIGRFGAPKGCYFEIHPSINGHATGGLWSTPRQTLVVHGG
jgi:hypothetical protein